MAEVTLSRGNGCHIYGGMFYDNEGTGDWGWYIGQIRQDYFNEKEYGAGCVAYAVPKINIGTAGRTIMIPCLFDKNTGTGKNKAVISTTAPSGLGWRFGPESGVISNEIEFDHETKNLSFSVTDGVEISDKTVYLYLYSHNDGFGTNGKRESVITKEFGDGVLSFSEKKEGIHIIVSDDPVKEYRPIIFSGSWKRYIPLVFENAIWKRKG